MGFKSFLRAILLGVDWDLAIALGVIDLIVGASLAISTLGAAGIVILVGAALVGIGGLGFWLRLLKQRASQRERIVGYYSAHKSANGNVSITAMQIWSVHADSWPETFALKRMEGQFDDLEALENLLKSDESTKDLWRKAQRDWDKRCYEALQCQQGRGVADISSKSTEERNR